MPRSKGRTATRYSRPYSASASRSLLDDLRSDEGMAWVPQTAWLTKLSIDSRVSSLNYDLAVDADGKDQPSAVAAGSQSPQRPAVPADLFVQPTGPDSSRSNLTWAVLVAVGLAVVGATLFTLRRTQAVRQ